MKVLELFTMPFTDTARLSSRIWDVVGICVIAIATLVGALPIRGDERMREYTMENLDIKEPVLENWLRKIFKIPDRGFAPIEGLPYSLVKPLEESKGSLSVFLRPEVNPHRVHGARWKVHAADLKRNDDIDLLQADYEAAGLQLRLTESVNLVLLKVEDLPSGPAAQYQAERLRRLIDVVVKRESGAPKWEFDVPAKIDSSSTAVLIRSRGAPMIDDLNSRYARADILLFNSKLLFIFYKKADQREFFEKDDRWFRQPAHVH
jgi:hypothetical protein